MPLHDITWVMSVPVSGSVSMCNQARDCVKAWTGWRVGISLRLGLWIEVCLAFVVPDLTTPASSSLMSAPSPACRS